MNDNQHPWYDRNGEPKRRNSGPGDERREPRRPSRPDNPGQGTPRFRSGAPSQDANQFANAAKSGGLFKSPFPTQPPASTRRPLSEPAPYESLDNNLIDNAAEPGFPPRREQWEGPPDSGMQPSRRPLSRPPEDTPEKAFEDLDGLPRPRKRPRPPNDQRPPSRRRSRPQEGDRGPAGELPIPSGRASRRPRALIFKGVLAFFLLMTCSSGSIVFLKIYHYYTFAQGVTNQALPTLSTKPGNNAPQATPLPTDLTGLDHFNMLLLGSDNDLKFGSGAVLTQTDIVVRVDLKNHKITMVSIPRDFYIRSDLGGCCVKLDEISGNEASGATPLDAKKTGFAHTVATIEADFGIPINAYAWVGLDGFVNVINTLGGVDVDVLHPIVDDAYPDDLNTTDIYAYKRLDIPAGPQHLDGLTALEYVRSRHSDLTGDFGRSARQQSVLLALKKKLEDPTIFTKLDQFADDLQGSVLTSLSISQVLQLANFAKGLKSTDFQQFVLSAPTYAHNAQLASGESIVQPDMVAIQNLLSQIFPDSGTTNTVNLQISPPDKQTVQAENVPILIENGTTTSGVAAKLESILKGEGFTVIDAQSADRDNYIQTQVEYFDPNKGYGTSLVLSKMLGVLDQLGTSPPQGAAIVVIIGSDTANAIMQSS